MKNRFMKVSNIGASSILIIVIILSLVCFAGLSLSSANADYLMCKKLADRTQNYYAATSEAYEALKIACENSAAADKDKAEEGFDVSDLDKAEDGLDVSELDKAENGLDVSELDKAEDGLDTSESIFEVETVINDNQKLKVRAVINPDNEYNYEIKEFRVVTIEVPEIDDSLSLLMQK